MIDDQQIGASILALLAKRAANATICPSEVARALAPERWRALMPAIRAVAVAMASAGEVELRQGGQVIAPDKEIRGPLRIGASSELPRDR